MKFNYTQAILLWLTQLLMYFLVSFCAWSFIFEEQSIVFQLSFLSSAVISSIVVAHAAYEEDRANETNV